jgi:L-ascorbate metabolism protein UlaG (beta-lactamase superfamily)
VEITWYGHACFRVREMGVTIVTDPYDREIGYTMPRIRANVVTISHGHGGHSCPRGFRGSPRVFEGPGEYEVGGVFITGVPTFHDSVQGQERGQNVAFVFDLNGLTVCHLGDLGHVPTQSHLEALDGANVLLIPVGGRSTLGAAQAAEVVGLLDPNIVIPMHYQIEGLSRDLAPVASFLKAMGVSASTPVDGLKVSASDLPDDRQVVVLLPRQSQ